MYCVKKWFFKWYVNDIPSNGEKSVKVSHGIDGGISGGIAGLRISRRCTSTYLQVVNKKVKKNNNNTVYIIKAFCNSTKIYLFFSILISQNGFTIIKSIVINPIIRNRRKKNARSLSCMYVSTFLCSNFNAWIYVFLFFYLY